MGYIKTLAIKLALVYGFFILCGFVLFRAWLITFSPYIAILSILLLMAELHNALQFFTMLYSLWPRNYAKFDHLPHTKDAQINMFICVCGEGADIVKPTILAAKKAAETYIQQVSPTHKPKVIVLNDGKAAKKSDWKEIEALCKELDVYHVARYINTGFKAGNLNNGMRNFPTIDAHNTFDVVLDADFAVIPEFLLEITKPFAEKENDFVQSPQRYRNETTWVAQAAAAHQIHFFEHVCPAKAYDNALFLCGTNFAIRRSALDAIGGMDEQFITEDYATSIRLHAAGKKGVFIKKPLAYGIAPSTLKAYFSQQKRWSKGTFDTSAVFAKEIVFGKMTKRQKYQYIVSSLYYLSGIRNLLFMLAPLPYLFFNIYLMRTNTISFLAMVYAPLFIYNFLVYFLLFQHPLKSWVLDTISFPIFISSFLSSVLKKELGFIVTIKKYEKDNIFQIYKVQLAVATMLLIGFIYAIANHRAAQSFGEFINYFWVIFNTTVLSLGFYLYMKDNYVLGTEGVTLTAPRRGSRFIPVLEFAIVAPLFIIALGLVVLQNPTVKQIVTPSNHSVFAKTQREVKQLTIPDEGAYYGYYLPEYNNHTLPHQPGLTPTEHPSLAMFYQDWGDKKPFDNVFLGKISVQNMIPVITWEPWDAKTAQQGDLVQKKYSPRRIINGEYDTYIRSWARQAADYHQPYFLRFAHEMNGDWYAWGTVNGNTPEDYRLMWQHVHDIFVQEGATNTIWVWAPNNEDTTASTDSIPSYYPGDAYVDWVGFSGFNWGNSATSHQKTFAQVSDGIYDLLSTYNKHIMIAETSTVGTDSQKRKWVSDALAHIQTMPKVKALVFYNAVYRKQDFTLSTTKNIETVVESELMNSEYFINIPHLVTTSLQ